LSELRLFIHDKEKKFHPKNPRKVKILQWLNFIARIFFCSTLFLLLSKLPSTAERSKDHREERNRSDRKRDQKVLCDLIRHIFGQFHCSSTINYCFDENALMLLKKYKKLLREKSFILCMTIYFNFCFRPLLLFHNFLKQKKIVVEESFSSRCFSMRNTTDCRPTIFS